MCVTLLHPAGITKTKQQALLCVCFAIQHVSSEVALQLLASRTLGRPVGDLNIISIEKHHK